MRKVVTANGHDDPQNGCGNDETNRGERQRREVVKADLDEEPGRTPDTTQYQPNDFLFHK
jgi:hypothetical protein